jgi:hypothetical protein
VIPELKGGDTYCRMHCIRLKSADDQLQEGEMSGGQCHRYGACPVRKTEA